MARLLIVDNDDRVVNSLETMFKAEGVDTRSTWSAREALELVRACPFDVVLVGDYLPDFHYGEFLKRAGQQSTATHIVLMHTGKPPATGMRRRSALGAVAVVDKTDPEQIRQAVMAQVRGISRLQPSIN